MSDEACPGCSSLVDPCSCVACPDCDLLAPVVDGLCHRCPCGWREDRCDCGELMTFDPVVRGTTCGGLAIVGALVCRCGAQHVCRKSKPADAVEWQLSKGGRSITAGGIKLRAETSGPSVLAMMERIVRLPELELEVARLQELLRRRDRA